MGTLIASEEGSPILISVLFVLPVVLFLIVISVQYWGIMTIYQQTEDLKYRALANMEIYGGLTEYDEQRLIDDLIKLGADPGSIRISGDLIRDGEPKLWPAELYLRIEFTPKHFNNFTAKLLLGRDPGEPLRIGVEGSVVSAMVDYDS